MSHTVVLTHWVHPETIRLLETAARVIPNETRLTLPREDILARAKYADAIMAFMPDCMDDAFLAACPRLKIVSAALKGYDNFSREAFEARNIWLTIAPDLLTAPTAELTVGLLLALSRNLLAGDQFVRSGAFQGWRPELYGTGLDGSTVGIIGMGLVGQAIAKRLAGFDPELLYSDPLERDASVTYGARRVERDTLLAASDFVITALPFMPETLHLLNRESVSGMKQGAYLINTGRGSVVDENAVAEALASGKLAGYAADVFEMEDWLRPDHPTAIPQALLDNRQQTFFTPHLGSAVTKVRIAIEQYCAESILQVLRGEKPQGVVFGRK